MILWGDIVGQQVEFPAVEQDAYSIVVVGSEGSGLRFDALNTSIKSFAHGIGNTVAKIAEVFLRWRLSIFATLTIGLS